MNILQTIGRNSTLFSSDIDKFSPELLDIIGGARVLVIGGAGSIGQAVTKEILKRNPEALHIVDISENNMVELVRDVRSSFNKLGSDFRTFILDVGGWEFDYFFAAEGPYDYIFNLSALKHVRSERDPYTLMRMIQVNLINTLKTIALCGSEPITNYFCVSTDKAANPVNMMGASKRIMEMFLMRESLTQHISMARFANVAFSDGSLLHGFSQRLSKIQPITAPKDIRRYFITPQESGELCLLSGLLGKNREIYFPKLTDDLNLINFPDIARSYIEGMGYEVFECSSEVEAKSRISELISRKKWPCYFFASDTAGEKDFEEFFTADEDLIMNQYEGVGIIKNSAIFNGDALDEFIRDLSAMKSNGFWTKSDLVAIFQSLLPNFNHKETGKYLDERM